VRTKFDIYVFIDLHV